MENSTPEVKKVTEQIAEGEIVKVSVRTLVEFILRSGDIVSGQGRMDPDALQAGSRLHRKIQKSMGSDYQAEVPLSCLIPINDGENSFFLMVEGRADGILRREDNSFQIDEIKSTYRDVRFLQEAEPVHLAQARCYAYMQAEREGLFAEPEKKKTVGVRLTYCSLETEQTTYIDEELSCEELSEWFFSLINEYKKWAIWRHSWVRIRTESIKKLSFPFPYRNGQKDLAAAVYRTIVRDRKLFAMAPTGVGKTLSTVFPAVKAMGEGEADKIFYLTAKTIVRTVAEESFALLTEKGLRFKSVTITAKEKVCILPKPDCNPGSCERARGHYDRINEAVYSLLTEEESVTRDVLMAYAERFQVCPFEFCLDMTLFADAVICDYNYVFDPDVSLKRFFAADVQNNFIFLVDEAHNLPDRAREMYSATLIKENFLQTKRILQKQEPTLIKRIEACNKVFLLMKRECDSFREEEDFSPLALALMRLMTECEEYMKDEKHHGEVRDAVLNLYFDTRHFLSMYEFAGKDYRFYTTYTEEGEFFARVQCMQPSRALAECLKKGKSSVFFSATLLPVLFYMDEIAGNEEEYTIYAPSPFSPLNRCVLIGKDFDGRYQNRGAAMFEQAAEYINGFTAPKKGNYMVFFSSYKMLTEIGDVLVKKLQEEESDTVVLRQKSNMSEREREDFLETFSEEVSHTNIGLCVLGGVFGEGIDLKGERLIGAVIVSTGLPLVCNERELFRRYYEEQGENGFDRAYLYPGMNKVQQAAGRVIRTMEDRGAVLLLDSRFANRQYTGLFPKEWDTYEKICLSDVEDRMRLFWRSFLD